MFGFVLGEVRLTVKEARVSFGLGNVRRWGNFMMEFLYDFHLGHR